MSREGRTIHQHSLAFTCTAFTFSPLTLKEFCNVYNYHMTERVMVMRVQPPLHTYSKNVDS